MPSGENCQSLRLVIRPFCKARIGPILFIVFLCVVLAAQSLLALGQSEEAKVDKAEQKQVVMKIGEILQKMYVFPEVAEKMSRHISERLAAGAYDSLTSCSDFAAQVEKDLRGVNKDLHLRVRFDPEQVERLRRREKDENDPELLERMLKEMRRANFGFREVKVLGGNIGYLDLRGFSDPRFAGETAVAAMNFLANCDALIIDLRNNGGGSAEMIQLISSYFFDSDPVHLNTFYWRPADETTQTWTLPHVPGKKMPGTDIYVLTSRRTFSAAEEFSYNLRNLKRATLVGETTGGGAHPGGPEVVNDRFLINVPKGRAINPITKTNWEGIGVEPHIKVSAEAALPTAQLKALEKLAAGAKNEKDKFRYDWQIDVLKAEINPVTVSPEILQSYAGKYGPRTIIFENGYLFYLRLGNPKTKLTALAEDTFMFKEAGNFRLKFVKENGVVTALQGLYDDGRTDLNKKEK